MEKTVITVEATVNAPLEKVWSAWTGPEHITKWNSASPDWHTPKATNDLRVGGKFFSRMEAKDGSMGFDFEGIYDEVRQHEYIEYHMADGRQVKTTFKDNGGQTEITTNFDAETENPVEMQKGGWQAIMDNFKAYTEKL
ncbi:MAG: polyketide cyclase [Bacteroidetes bacterium]|nr:polyketide cyclase [Bacteroidota bacterium]